MQPLTCEEQQQLLSVYQLAGYLAPGLRLLAHDLLASSVQLQHLYPSSSSKGSHRASASTTAAAEEDSRFEVQLDPDAATAYKVQAGRVLPGGFSLNPRLQLSAFEEQRLLHKRPLTSAGSSSVTSAWRCYGLFNPIQQLAAFPVDAGMVQDIEQQLQQLVVPAAAPEGSASITPEYPLTYNTDLPLEKEMHEELKHSWECHHRHPEPTEVVPGSDRTILQLQVRTCTTYAGCAYV
jgi:hypothetical protein